MGIQGSNTPILSTKLHRPQIARDHLHREHLLEQLNQGLHRPLTLVSAPAGYGKSTLVSCWLESCETPSAWLSLDKKDNDLHSFLSYFLAAVRSIFPDIGRESQTLLEAPDLPPIAILSRTLINNLDQIKTQFILVLDDYHLIKEGNIHDLMSEILTNPPGKMHLVVATRRDPSFPLSKLLAGGLVTAIRMRELRFSANEIALFLKRVVGITVSDKTANQMEEKTEGWIAGLRLATLSLHPRADLDRTIENLQFDDRHVADFFNTEVLNQQPQAIQKYLLVTAILERFCAPLCEAVCFPGTDPGTCEMGGKEFLEWLDRANLFVIPLDNQYRWFRYHHLFRKLLQEQLVRWFNHDEIAILHKRSAVWFAKNDLIEDSLHHSLAGGDNHTAGRLVAHHRHDLMNREEWHRLRLWLDMLPRDIIENGPELLMTKAWLLIGWSEMVEVMTRVEALLASMPPDSVVRQNMQGEWDTLNSLLHYHMADGTNALTHANHALENLPPGQTSERGLAVMLQTLSYQMTGDIRKARSVALDALKEKDTQLTTYSGRVLITFCFMDYIQADLKGVRQAATQCLNLGQEAGLAEIVAHGYYFLGITHYERNELVKAEDYLIPVVKGPYIVNVHNYGFSGFALAQTYQAQGRPDRAREIVESVIDYAMNIRNTSLLKMSQAFQAEIAIRQGQIAEAYHWANTFDPDPLIVAYRFYVPQITLAKWFLAQNTTESQTQAAQLLSRLEVFFTSTHNTRLLFEVLALQAMLFDAQGNEDASTAVLERSVTLAQPGGFIRPFLDLGTKIDELLTHIRDQNITAEYIRQILAAFQEENTHKPSSSSGYQLSRPSVVSNQESSNPLTRRELEILDLLEPGLVNKEIASQLFISPETVKRHTKNIFRKLNVSNRRQAVAQAFKLGILHHK